MSDDTGFSANHQIQHTQSYPSGAQQYRCEICGQEVIVLWTENPIIIVLDFGNIGLHQPDNLLPDWVEGLDL